MSISTIPPELFPVIASFLPFRSARFTLLPLALTSHHIYTIVRPVLYSRLILKNEDAAILAIQRLLDEPYLATHVREIHIMAELSADTREGRKPFDAIDGLQFLLEGELLPQLAVLGIYLLDGWVYDEDFNLITSHGRLGVDFWRGLRADCPELKSITLRNVGHSDDDPWFSGRGLDAILKFENLSTLRLESIDQLGLKEEDTWKVIQALPHLASTLHTLSLHTLSQRLSRFTRLDFPDLRWLRLQGFDATNLDVSTTMEFFRRHPQLESVSLINANTRYLSGDVEEGFLPNLKHLKAGFADIRGLAPILPQLTSLSFTESINCQVPYLLREILPNGLPGLKSLEIDQMSIGGLQIRSVEGVLWFETEHGVYRQEKRRVGRDFRAEYLHSVVRGAPNLEELGLHGVYLYSAALAKNGPTLAQLEHLKCFYYHGFAPFPADPAEEAPPEEELDALLADFLLSAEDLARLCPRLERVVSNSSKYLPYVSALVERDEKGAVEGVRQSDGVGMEVSAQEGDPFPFDVALERGEA